VVAADDGGQRIEIAFAQKPEAIICDLLLPKMSGLQICRALREKLESTKIIIVAGRHYDVDRAVVLEAGGDDYFVKPLKWDKLEKALKRKRRPPRKLTPRQSRALKFQPPSTRLKFWGVRGSIPVPGPSTIGYGGHAPCAEVRTAGEHI